MKSLDETPDEAPPGAEHLRSLRDAMRCARRWQELLGPAERQHLFADIAWVALAVGSDLYPDRSIQDGDVGVALAPEGDGDACPRERLAFLSATWPRLSRALARIEAAPVTRLQPGERPAAPERGSVRQMAPAAVLAALRSGDLTPVGPEAMPTPLSERLGGRLPRRMAVRAVLPGYETPENRAVKAILVQLARDLGGIAALAGPPGAEAVFREATALREEVCRRLRREPWRAVSPAVGIAARGGTPPAYRFLFEFWRRYRRAFAFDWTNPLFTLPTRETWQIYEYWCLFTVADALRALGLRCRAADGFALTRPGLTFSLVKGRAARLVFARECDETETVALTYSPTFPRAEAAAASAPEGHWRSRSHAMRPDIALEAAGSLLLFDAKFKTYAGPDGFTESALLPDIHQMHAYRDAIRDDRERGGVQSAWLLYAGRREGHSPAVVAYPTATAVRPYGNGDVGALLLRPGGDHRPLRQMIAAFLRKE